MTGAFDPGCDRQAPSRRYATSCGSCPASPPARTRTWRESTLPAVASRPTRSPLAVTALPGTRRGCGFILHHTNRAVRLDEIVLCVDLLPGGPVDFRTWLLPLAGVARPPAAAPAVQPAPGTFRTRNLRAGRPPSPCRTRLGTPCRRPTSCRQLAAAGHRQPAGPCRGQWTAPFLYEDHRRLFYVTTAQRRLAALGIQVFGHCRSPGRRSPRRPCRRWCSGAPGGSRHGEAVAVDTRGRQPVGHAALPGPDTAATKGRHLPLPRPSPTRARHLSCREF